jgi:MFS family permease
MNHSTDNRSTGSVVPRGTWFHVLVVAVLVALRIVFDLTVGPMGDESYYWIWGQRPQLSYLDHPPLHAWLLSLVGSVFGWSSFSLRLLTWLTLAGSLWILWLFSGLLSPENRQQEFWRSAAVYLSLPLIVVATTPAFHDHLLAALALATIYAMSRFTQSQEDDRSDLRYFYAAALFAGLATLTKYNGILLAVGFAVFLTVRPRLRSMWRTPHPYLAALIVASIQLPVLIWNVNSGFPTLSLHLVERPEVHWEHPDAMGLVGFVLGMLMPLGPFVLVGFALLAFGKSAGFVSLHRSLVLCMFAVSTACVAVASLFTDVLLHWNLVAYIAVATIAASTLRWPLLGLPHFLLTLYLATVFTWNYSVAPISVPLFTDPGTAANYGWAEVAEAVRGAQVEHPDAFLAATRYTYASQLAFQLRDPDVTAFNALPSQYDLWWDPDSQTGRDAIIVADRAFTINYAGTFFDKVEHLARVPVIRQGVTVWQFDVYLAESYDPGPR